MRTTLSTPSTRTMRRVIAVTLTILFTLTFTTSALAVAGTGGDHGVCSDGLWLKADWTGEGWDWETGPAWDGDAPTAPALTVTSSDDGDPMTVTWTSDTDVLKASVKASTEYAGFSGGYSGTVTDIDGHAISHIVFCYASEPVLVPSIDLDKTPDVDTITYAPDDGDQETVTYTYVVTNTGDTPLTAITLVDDVLGTITLTDADLAAGASTTGTATHVVTAADADAGQILNTAVTTGLAPDDTQVSDTDSATVTVQTPEPVLVPSIDLDKTPDVDTITYAPDDGDQETVTYTYVVTNTGDTPLTAITLVDDVLGTITLTDADLAAGASTTGTATHVVTAADADAGQILNTAVTTGLAPDDTQVDATDTVTVLVEQVAPNVVVRPEVSLEKTALVTPDDDGRKVVVWSESAPAGTQITYEYVVTNTGEAPLTGITLVDDVLGTITLTDTDLAVGESMTVTTVHTVTEADADAGSVTNEAVVTATDPEGAEVSDTAAETVLVAEVKGEVIDKEEAKTEVRGEVIDKEEQLPVTGAATALLAIVASLSLATGAGLLRASRRKE